MFDRHKGAFFQKKRYIHTNKENVYMGVYFSFKKWLTS